MELIKLTCGEAFAEIYPVGACIHRLCVPDRNGNVGDVVRHADDPAARYMMKASTIGRFANRIAFGRYTVDGKTVQLETNERGTHTLHSASGNYANREFTPERLSENAVRMTLREEGEGGFPGGADVAVTFTLSESDGGYALAIHYEVTPDETSPVNMTNHAYFNLSGDGDVLDHILWLDAERFTPKGDIGMPVGEFKSVEGTPFDFRTPRSFREAYESAKEGDFMFANAFDDNFELCGEGMRIFARVIDPASGRVMEGYTDLPGMQLYTPNMPTNPFPAFCLETHYFPNSVNCPEYRASIIKGGETYVSNTIYRFTVE